MPSDEHPDSGPMCPECDDGFDYCACESHAADVLGRHVRTLEAVCDELVKALRRGASYIRNSAGGDRSNGCTEDHEIADAMDRIAAAAGVGRDAHGA